MTKPIALRYKDYSWSYLLCHPWQGVSWLRKELRWFMERGLYGYSARDLWNLDYYIACVLPPALREFGDRAQGVPFGMFDSADAPELEGDLGITGGDPNIASGYERWRAFLSEIADGLERGREDPMSEEDMEAVDKAFGQLGRWFGNLWD